jgi:hypothetical protein
MVDDVRAQERLAAGSAAIMISRCIATVARDGPTLRLA